MPTIAENLTYWKRYDWKDRGREWGKGYGSIEQGWDHAILPRVGPFLPTAGHVLELAPGYGAWTDLLRPCCKRMTLVDLAPNCIEHCRQRFGKRGMAYHVNDGRSLAMVEEMSVDFVFSVHSLVHADHDVMRDYILQLGKIMKPGAFGFIHHSNLGEYADELESWDQKDTHWRGRDMTGEKLRNDCREAGLVCIYQEIIPWGSDKFIDAYSLFAKPRPGQRLEERVERNAEYWPHVWKRIKIAERYTRPD
ncbi:MAG: class I SAM-dependent methyltransferase [Planctomycetota bacterium]|nr:class I SAM-dependent methyltransferase [Planctomycetota bacterium]